MKNLCALRSIAPALAGTAGLWLAGCYGSAASWGGGECAGGGYGYTGDYAQCTDWNDYDDDWHRRHWDEPGVNWCNAPDAGWASMATPDSGVAANDGSEAPSADGTSAADSGTGSGGSTDGATATTLGTSTDGASSGASTDGGLREAATGATTDGGTGDSGHPGDSNLGPACTVGTTCAVGSACVVGSCQPCSSGVCLCQRDDDCPASQICDHSAGRCAEPPPPCTALTTEADCTARTDCTSIYGGMSCTNDAGSPCHSGEANCTCATYSFAACVVRAM